jgi:hypothetical protein
MILVVVGVALALAACGGGSPTSDPSTTTTTAATGGSSSRAASSGVQKQDLEYAQCMRSHGVTNFPDPSGNAGGSAQSITKSGVNPNSPTFQAANSTCQKYEPTQGNGTQGPSSGADTQQLKFAQCMRSHGVPNFPDPSSNPSGGQRSVTQYGINPNSPTFEAANQACSSLLSGSGS